MKKVFLDIHDANKNKSEVNRRHMISDDTTAYDLIELLALRMNLDFVRSKLDDVETNENILLKKVNAGYWQSSNGSYIKYKGQMPQRANKS